MRYIEIVSGARLPVNQEEIEIIDKIKETGPIEKSTLGERELEVARKMVSRSILKNAKVDGKPAFDINDQRDIWRF